MGVVVLRLLSLSDADFQHLSVVRIFLGGVGLLVGRRISVRRMRSRCLWMGSFTLCMRISYQLTYHVTWYVNIYWHVRWNPSFLVQSDLCLPGFECSCSSGRVEAWLNVGDCGGLVGGCVWRRESGQEERRRRNANVHRKTRHYFRKYRVSIYLKICKCARVFMCGWFVFASTVLRVCAKQRTWVRGHLFTYLCVVHVHADMWCVCVERCLLMSLH